MTPTAPPLAVLMVVASVMFGSPATAARPCRVPGGSAPRSSPEGARRGLHYLTDVRAGAHRCFDRVTFEVRPATDQGSLGYRLAYESPPIRQDGSGKPVDVRGRAFLVVRLAPVRDVDLSGSRPEPTYRGPDSVRPRGGTRIVEVRHISSFEGTVKWAIGVDTRRSFRVATLDSPTRLVVDVG